MKTSVTRRRAVRIAPMDVLVRRAPGGVVYMSSAHPLGGYPASITDRLEHWAQHAPDRVFIAQRDGEGWRRLTYAQAFEQILQISQALLKRKLSSERPVLILSGNGIDHALLALASMHVGILYAPIAPAYSLQAKEFGTLGQVFERVRPGLVFAAEGAAYERALRSVLPPGVELVISASRAGDLPATSFADLASTPATSEVEAAHARVGPDTVGKILFTSGSTGRPKGVINTQRMLCANQEMIRSVLQFLTDAPPVLCDWLPWNHTAGGNHNFGLVLYNGGTFYIDEGRPTPAGIETTVQNLREIAATAHFTVPRTYEMLLPYLKSDAALRERFFSELKVLFYAAAGLSQRFFDELTGLAVATCGEEILWMTGFGATETAPFAFTTGALGSSSGMVGLPAPGMEVKLAPVGTKLEARVRGANVTPGFFADEAMTAAAFDEEGYYRLGDAMKFVDPAAPEKGLMFDGRLAEDFKLSSATWVSVGPLRTRILQQGAGLVQDVVIAGHDRAFVAALIFPNAVMCRALCPHLAPDAPMRDVCAEPAVRERFQSLLTELARASTGSSTFVERALVLEDAPSLDAGEITDKGSLNQRAVLQNRAALVEQLYETAPSERVLVA